MKHQRGGDEGASGPYRAAACAGCGGAATREDVGLCGDCVRETMERARRILAATPAVPPRQRRWPYLAGTGVVLGLSFTLAMLPDWQAVVRAHQRARLDATPRAAMPRAAAITAATPAPAAASGGEAPLPWPPHLLAASGPPTHDPEALLARARRLAAAGVDLPVVEVTLPASVAPFQSFAIEPYAYRGAGVIGVRLLGWQPEQRALGLEPGDVVTAVDGWPVDRDRDEWARPFLAPAGSAVIEVLRDRRRVVVAIRWKG